MSPLSVTNQDGRRARGQRHTISQQPATRLFFSPCKGKNEQRRSSSKTCRCKRILWQWDYSWSPVFACARAIGKSHKEIYVSKKDRERCRREVTCRHAVILKREIKTLQKTFVANGIRDKTLNPFSLDRKSVVLGLGINAFRNTFRLALKLAKTCSNYRY